MTYAQNALRGKSPMPFCLARSQSFCTCKLQTLSLDIQYPQPPRPSRHEVKVNQSLGKHVYNHRHTRAHRDVSRRQGEDNDKHLNFYNLNLKS